MTSLMVSAIAFVAVFLMVHAVAGLWGAGRRLAVERVQRHGGGALAAGGVKGTGGGGTGGAPAPNAELLLDRYYSSFGAFDRMLRKSSYAEQIQLDLERAAVPLRVGEYLFIRWILAVGLWALTFWVLHLNPVFCLVVGVAGYFAPRFYVSRKEASRTKKFEEQLVDGLMMMANSLKSGSSFLQAIDLVAHEQPAPISQEFARVVAESNVGASLENSLLDLSLRVRSYDLYLVVTAMLVQREVGGNLSEVLENIAHTIRERQRLLRQAQVETAEVRLSGYVIAALPIVFLVLMLSINKAYADALLTGIGQFVLIVGGIMEAIGFYIIQRIVNIEV